MLPFSSDCYDYFVYPEDSESFQRETELPSKLDVMDGLRALEFESSTVPTVLWSSNDCDIHLEDTDSLAYVESLSFHPLLTHNAARHRHLESSSGDFLGLPQLSPDESPFSTASSSLPLTPEGVALLPDLFCHPMGEFGLPNVAIDCSPFLERQPFMEDSVYCEQLQEDLACQDMPSSPISSGIASQRMLVLSIDDDELAYEPSSTSVVSQTTMTERSGLSEGLAENITSPVQVCISPRFVPCSPHTTVRHQLSSRSTSQQHSVLSVETLRGVKRRRIDDDDDDYEPHHTLKRAASSQTHSHAVKSGKPRGGRLRPSKRMSKYKEVGEERFECLMLIHGCKKSFTRKNDMERHLGSCKFNSDLRSLTVKCPHCKKSLSRRDALLRHIKQSHADVQ